MLFSSRTFHICETRVAYCSVYRSSIAIAASISSPWCRQIVSVLPITSVDYFGMSYSWLIAILCSFSLCFSELPLLCYNTMAHPAQHTRHILLYIRLTPSQYHILVCLLYFPWPGSRTRRHSVIPCIYEVPPSGLDPELLDNVWNHL